MTPSELKAKISKTESHFFDRETMKFFGDSMRNYGVRSVTVQTQFDGNGNYINEAGIEVEAWELYRKRPVKHGIKTSAYFRKDTYTHIAVKED